MPRWDTDCSIYIVSRTFHKWVESFPVWRIHNVGKTHRRIMRVADFTYLQWAALCKVMCLGLADKLQLDSEAQRRNVTREIDELREEEVKIT
jgi:hypothetical protein